MSKIKKYLNNPSFIILKFDEFNLIRLKDEMFLKLKYKRYFGKKLNLENPKTFNEKLQWLKLHDRKDIYTTMVDKCETKKYVANTIGEEYVIQTLGVYDKFNDIDFEKLPNQFVLKCTHDSGGIAICKDKKYFNLEDTKKKINKSLNKNFYYEAREWPYKNVKPRIIAEKFMSDECQGDELIDFKFFCFNGIPKFLYVSEGMSNKKTKKISFANMKYEKMEFNRKDYRQFEKLPPKPVNFEKMKELAKILAKDTIFLRVDFYEINFKVYFSELTFYPNGGFMPIYPEEYDKILGDMLELPNIKIGDKQNEK